jgi:hypothetical protein
MNVKLHVEARAQHVGAEEIFRTRFFDCVFEDFRAFGKFASDVNVSGMTLRAKQLINMPSIS